MIRVCYIISDIHSSQNMEWVLMEISKIHDLSVVLLNKEIRQSRMKEFLKENHIPFLEISYSGKVSLIKAVFKTHAYLRSQKINVVHCHLFEASLVGLTAAKIAGIKNRVHTRHNATIHHDYYPQAVKYDRYINRLSTKIIAISLNVKNILVEREGVDPSKIVIIKHGFKWDAFDQITDLDIKSMRAKYHITNENYPVIGVVSRYIEWKGIQYVIPAFSQLLKEYPNAKLVLANAHGPFKAQIQNALKQLPENSYIEIDFEENIYALFKLFTVYVHVPIDRNCEAFGQTYIESMAMGIPSVYTLSGIAHDVVKHLENALVVDYKNSDQIYSGIIKLMKDTELRNTLSRNSIKVVKSDFDLKFMIEQLNTVYKN